MTIAEEISTVADLLAVLALINWVGGDRSIRGRDLLIRRGAVWVALRWIGLGAWIATFPASGHQDLWLDCAGVVGAVLLLLGTARQVSNSRFTISVENQSGEQADAGNRGSG